MNIYHYLNSVDFNECAADNPWKDCFISANAVLDKYDIKPLVSINGQPIVRQHQSTYITGKETCHATYYAKMVAGAVLAGEYPQIPNVVVHDTVPVSFTTEPSKSDPNPKPKTITTTATPRSVLWIDTVNGPHTCARFFRDMQQQFQANEKNFNLVCLDMLGVFRDDFYVIIGNIQDYIHKYKPALVVIDDIDHFMPHCGINVASRFNRIVRDTLNHTETSFLFIGYNNIGKRTSTTGELGKFLFPCSNTIISISTKNEISKVKLVKGYDYYTPDVDFLFTIGKDHLPHQVAQVNPSTTDDRAFIQRTSLRDIMESIINPGETISPDDLLIKINDRRQQLNRIDRSRALIAQATSLGIISKTDNNDYSLNPHQAVEVVRANGSYNPDGITSPNSQSISEKDNSINNNLTFPSLLSTTPHPINNEPKNLAAPPETRLSVPPLP